MLRSTRAILGFVLLGALLLVSPSHSQAQCPGLTSQVMAYAKETLTMGPVAKGLTLQVYQVPGVSPVLAVITIEGGAVRYDVTGTPTASDGHPVGGDPPQSLVICGLSSIQGFKAILHSATSAQLFVTYYRIRP